MELVWRVGIRLELTPEYVYRPVFAPGSYSPNLYPTPRTFVM
jgi:hypothetical protein